MLSATEQTSGFTASDLEAQILAQQVTGPEAPGGKARPSEKPTYQDLRW